MMVWRAFLLKRREQSGIGLVLERVSAWAA